MVIEIMALSDEKIFPSVVVEEANSPARVSYCHLANSCGVAGIAEGAMPLFW
jgi:hypothetical protein